MSDFNEAVDSSVGQDEGLSPGERLRNAREQSGLSRKEAASHLKLSVDKIDSLERGEVDQLAAPVFVAGYLRAYAKLVGLPEDEIIASFKALSMMDAPSMDPSSSPAANNYGQMEAASTRRGIKASETDWGQMAIWGSVVIVLALVVFVFFTGDQTENIAKVDEKSIKTETASITVTEVNDVNEQSERVEDKKGSELMAVEPEMMEIQEPVVESRVVEPKKIVKENVANEDITTASAPREVTTASAPRDIDAENLNHSVAVFNFKEDSWIEVTDALGKRLLFRLGKAGSSRTVWGVAPFKVHVGYVQGVDVIFNGKPYDLTRFANRRSARFGLGETGDRMSAN